MKPRAIDFVFAVLILSLVGIVTLQAWHIQSLNSNMDRLAGIVSRLWEIWGK